MGKSQRYDNINSFQLLAKEGEHKYPPLKEHLFRKRKTPGLLCYCVCVSESGAPGSAVFSRSGGHPHTALHCAKSEYGCVYVCLGVHVCVCMCVHVCACMCMCMCVYT